jgi:hypothetical protein
MVNRVKSSRGYATVIEDEGVNYREIADIMTQIGFIMNHSSARNYVLRVMSKFAEAFDKNWSLNLSEDQVRSIAHSPSFQSAIADLLHNIENIEKENN